MDGKNEKPEVKEVGRIEKKKKLIGQILLEAGVVTKEQLEDALEYQRMWGGKIGANLIRKGYISEEELTKFLSEQFGVPGIDLYTEVISKDVVEKVPVEVANKFKVFPVELRFDDDGNRVLILAMSDPTNTEAIEVASSASGYPIHPVLASDLAIEASIQFYYYGKRFSTDGPEKQSVLSGRRFRL